MNYTLDLRPLIDSINDEELQLLSSRNPDLKFETDAHGNLIVMPPTGSESGEKNGNLFGQVWNWNRQYKLGKVFDSSTGFKLSNGAVRSPDVSWIALHRWNSLTAKQKRGFAPINPDFVIELMSPSDDLSKTQHKMTEYLSCGVKLGWLIAPDEAQVEIYRINRKTEILNSPNSLSGENILHNLIIDLADIF
jgi:Uma2 family endonuclease